MPNTKLRAKQILTEAGPSVEAALAALGIVVGTNSITLPDGTIIKRGSVAATASIGANTVFTITVTFDTPFPNQCDYFNALMQPAASTDFYGVTTLVSKTATQVQFTVRNGATAQALLGGTYLAIGS